MSFDLAELRAFVALADMGNFGKAADSLNLSQPALSRRIEKLEAALDTRLFERTTRSVELTAIGRNYLDSARHILGEVESSLLFSRDLSYRGEINIACIPSAVALFLPGVIADYHQQFPGMRIRIADESAAEILVAVMRGQADFGITYLSAEEPDLEFETILEEPFVVVCPADHPLAAREQLRWQELAGQRYLTLAHGSVNRTLIDLALVRAKFQPDWYCEVRHVPALVSLVAAGLGVGVVPRLAMPWERHPSLACVPLTDPSLSRTLGVVKRRGRPLSPAAHRFHEMLRSSLAQNEVLMRMTCSGDGACAEK